MKGYVKVALKSEIPEDTGKLVQVEGVSVALFKWKDKVYALESSCVHRGGPLAEGGLHGQYVMCPWHGWEFDITTGKCAFNEDFYQRVYKVKESGDEIYLKI